MISWMILLRSWCRKLTQVSSRAPLSATMLVFNSASRFDSVMITSFRRKGKEYSSRTYTSVKNLSRKGSYSHKGPLILDQIEGCFEKPLVRWQKEKQILQHLRTWVWTDEAAVTSTLNTPLWLSTHFMPGSWTYITVKFIPFNTQSKYQGAFSGKMISSQSLSSCLHQGWVQSSLVGAFQLRQVNWRSLFLVGRAASEGSTTSWKKGTRSLKMARQQKNY